MQIILKQEILPGALRHVKSVASKGYFNGRDESQYFRDCSWWIQQYECQIIFTRDIGHHSSGWWKNPDYERCWHLSISFKHGQNKRALDKIIDGLFGPDKKLIWIEPAYSKEGKSKDIWHYRLFCDEHWQPILPRGEVYSKEFTEMGWKSYSEVQEESKKWKL